MPTVPIDHWLYIIYYMSYIIYQYNSIYIIDHWLYIIPILWNWIWPSVSSTSGSHLDQLLDVLDLMFHHLGASPVSTGWQGVIYWRPFFHPKSPWVPLDHLDPNHQFETRTTRLWQIIGIPPSTQPLCLRSGSRTLAPQQFAVTADATAESLRAVSTLVECDRFPTIKWRKIKPFSPTANPNHSPVCVRLRRFGGAPSKVSPKA